MKSVAFLFICGSIASSTVEPNSECQCKLMSCASNSHWSNYETVCSRMNSYLVEGKKNDFPNEQFYPYVRGSANRWDVWPGVGTVLLQEPLFKGSGGNIFSATVDMFHNPFDISEIELGDRKRRRPDGPSVITPYVVKYSSDCQERLRGMPAHYIHPLLWEYVVLQALNDTGITPVTYYLSPESTLANSDFPVTTSRFEGTFMHEHPLRCGSVGTSVRFMVQARAGPSLEEYVSYMIKSGLDNVRFAKRLIRIVRKLIDLFETLHSKGIVHGDIHGGNIVYRTPVGMFGEMDDDFVLIDFEHAVFSPRHFGEPDLLPKGLPAHLATFILSPWQLAGHRKGPRDDLYRLIYLLGDALSGRRHSAGIKRMIAENVELLGKPQRGNAEYRNIDVEVSRLAKTSFNLFAHSIPLASVARIGWKGEASASREIINRLENIHRHIRMYPSPDSLIDYKWIKESFDSIIALL